MKNRLFKNRNEKGFSLIEVMIGMTILTIAIVAATSILIALINSNKAITRSLQAFYLAEEGIEGIRNIRDTNALNNLNYLGKETDLSKNIWPELKVDGTYSIFMTRKLVGNTPVSPQQLGTDYAPWILIESPNDDQKKICFKSGGSGGYFSDCGGGGDSTDFIRVIKITYYCNQDRILENLCKDFPVNGSNSSYQPKAVIVTSTVTFGGKSISLDAVLTDWKSNRQ